MINFLLKALINKLSILNYKWEDPSLILTAKSLINSFDYKKINNIHDAEFQCFSQFGDDGIIQYLINTLDIKSQKFIEFGVGDYFESNTHFLLVNNNWSGFVIDGSKKNIDRLINSEMYWRFDLKAISSFITKENINLLISQSGFENIGLLHIDLDGNDYWILDTLNLDKLKPDILILEYNSIFGPKNFYSTIYRDDFDRYKFHESGKIYGASLSLLNKKASDLGYYLIGCNSSGNNAYFLKNDYNSIISKKSVEECFCESKFFDFRKNGKLQLRNNYIIPKKFNVKVFDHNSCSEIII